LDIVFGKKSDPRAVEALVEVIRDQDWEGTLYVGYPVLAGEEATSVTDALLTTRNHGAVIFDLSSHEFIDLPPGEIDAAIMQRQRELRRKLNSRLVGYEDLCGEDGLSLAFPINVLTFLTHPIPNVGLDGLAYPENLLEKVTQCPALPEQFYRPLNAAIQKTAALRPRKKRLNVKNEDSMGALIKKLEAQIANLDKWQKNAAIESPEGPQRIRGLAGSGKTIILALKAAYLHANDPEADIVVTFNTRSLYQQFKGLIRRFYFDQVGDEPDWGKLRILHAWGSETAPGVYSTIASASGMAPMAFGAARYRFGYNGAFEGVCQELVSHLRRTNFRPIVDYVLIDEAQDFPASFFQLAYLSCKPPKRIVWAYDELQNLNDSSMPTLDQLFGVTDDGSPVVQIPNDEGKPKQDILLPICYRNPPWLLSLALGLGLGIKRPNNQFAQMFSDPEIWKEIGYEDLTGILGLGQPARLRRAPDRSAGFFADMLEPAQSVIWHRFDTSADQATWIAADIQRVLATQELDHNDILIVIPDSINAPKIGAEISDQLKRFSIASHIIGVTGSSDLVFVENSIAMSGIYRAKGNEAPLVYVVHAEYCAAEPELSRKRNMLFTALTRAKAWVRICGVGAYMDVLAQEIGAIAADQFELRFNYPTPAEIQRLRSAYKERTAKEKRAVRTEIRSATKLLQRILNGEVDLSELPPELADLLRKGLR
jgi:superfamily I DNA and RNA helicase